MKKLLIILIVLISAITVSACSNLSNGNNQLQNNHQDTTPSLTQENAEKSCKIEVLSAKDDILIKTIDDPDIVRKFFQIDEWEQVNKPTQDFVPEFKLVVYQETTLLAGQDPNIEREYEIIAHITTFKDSSYVEECISSDMVKNIKIPEEYLTFYYSIPDDTLNELRQ